MRKYKTVWLALLTMLLWGSLYPMVKLGFSAYDVKGTADILLFAGIRFFICGGLIALFTAIRAPRSYGAAKGSLLLIFLSGFFAIVLHYGLSYLGLEHTDSSKTALIKQVGALVYICFSFVLIKEDLPSLKKTVAALVGFLGVVALNFTPNGISFSVGDVLILCSSFCTVFSNVIGKKVFEKKVSPITFTGISQLFGGIVLFAIGFAMGGSVRFGWNSSLLIMVYICTASIVSYCVWFGVVQSGELSKLFIIKFSEPVFTCLFGALILGENIWRVQYLISFLLISGSICFANMGKFKNHSTDKILYKRFFL